MIVAVAFCPHPPALLPDVAQGAAPDLADVRAAAVEAVRTVARPGMSVLVVGAGPANRYFPPGALGSMAGFGVEVTARLGRPEPAPAADEPPRGHAPLPLSLTVGAWLLREALGSADLAAGGWSFMQSRNLDPDAVHALAERAVHASCALLVMGDGSARRSTSAPGHLDERAAGFDATVAAALAGGDPRELARIDPALGGQLLAAGVPAWHAAAAVLAGHRFRAALQIDAAPRGVGYFVATWLAPDVSSESGEAHA
ncbi:MAG TPA: hypothetical protein VGH01_08410 [Jatrophihabitantaceae bacterium]